MRVTVGKKTLEDGGIDMLGRATGEQVRVPAAEIATRVKEMLHGT